MRWPCSFTCDRRLQDAARDLLPQRRDQPLSDRAVDGACDAAADDGQQRQAQEDQREAGADLGRRLQPAIDLRQQRRRGESAGTAEDHRHQRHRPEGPHQAQGHPQRLFGVCHGGVGAHARDPLTSDS
jgi:hypothetical protein